MTTLRFTLAKGVDPPRCGDIVSTPIDGEWLELGTFVRMQLADDGSVVVSLRLHEQLQDVSLAVPVPMPFGIQYVP